MTVAREDAIAVAALVALITLLFFNVLFLGVSLAGGDLPSYHFPLKKTLHDLVAAGEFPIWNRLIEAGQPIAANPAYELFYPPQWLIFLPSFVLGFKLHILLHYYIAALGMYALCRALRLGSVASFVAATAFALGGPLISVSGYLPFLFSMSWLPWLLFFGWRFHERRAPSDFVLASLAFAMQLLVGEPTIVMQSAAFLLLGGIAVRKPWWAMAILFAGAATAAVQILPAIDHARDSVRSIPFDYSVAGMWSTEPLRFLELFLRPTTHGQQYIASIFVGYPIAVLALAGFVRRIPGWKWALGAVAVLWLIALGRHTPLLRVLYDLRLFSSIRYPEKFLFGALFVLILFGAAALDRLIEGDDRIRWIALVIAAVALLASPLHAALTAALLAALRRKSMAIVWGVFAAAELFAQPLDVLRRVDDSYYARPPQFIAQLPPPAERTFDRTYRPAAWGKPVVMSDDYDQTMLFPSQRLHLTAEIARQRNDPSWPLGFMALSNATTRIDGGRVIREAIDAPRYAFATRIVPCRDIFDCSTKAAPRIALTPPPFPAVTLPPGDVLRANERQTTADLDVIARGRALLTISVTFHKYWQATIDGKAAQILPANLAYQALVIPPGRHHVRLEYHNPLIVAGAIISALALLAQAYVASRSVAVA